MARRAKTSFKAGAGLASRLLHALPQSERNGWRVPRTAIAAVPPYTASRIAQLHKFLDKWNLVLVVIDGPLALRDHSAGAPTKMVQEQVHLSLDCRVTLKAVGGARS